MLDEHGSPFLYTLFEVKNTKHPDREVYRMKYIVLVSHGTMAPGVHNALSMLAGSGRADILSTSLENGMGSMEFAENVRKCISGITKEDEIILLGDLIGGSPLTTAANVIAEEGLLDRTTMLGGMNLPLALSAAVMKDNMETSELVEMLIPESREMLQEFKISSTESEDEI